MPFEAKVVMTGLVGIDRKIRAAEHSYNSAKWGVKKAQQAVIDQAKDLENKIAVLNMIEENLKELYAEKDAQKEKKPD